MSPPATLPYPTEPGQLPEEFRALRHFVCWEWERRSGKWTKPPVSPVTGARGDCSDPATWATFAQAVAYAQAHRLPGIGIQLTEAMGIIGGDLDKCRDPVTTELTPAALAIVDRLATLTQVSPTGTGLRLFARAAFPPWFVAAMTGEKTGRKDPARGIEIYAKGRYLTLTTVRVPGTPDQIQPRQAELDAWLAELFPAKPPPAPGAVGPGAGGRGATGFDDAGVVRRCEEAVFGTKFQRLFWRGDCSDYPKADGTPDESAGDLGLCSYLRFYSGDRTQVERLWARSALGQRDKFRRAGYRASTLDKAMVGEVYTPPLAVELDDAGARANGAAAPEPPAAAGGSGGPTPAGTAPKPKGKGKGAPDRGLVPAIAERILARSHFAREPGGALYRYDGGVYGPGGERFVRARVKAVLVGSGKADAWTSHIASEVLEFISVDAPELWARPPDGVVNVANGLLELATRTLRPHHPDHLTQVQLPVAYDPAARCPAWEAFLEPIFPPDALAAGVPWEIAADLMQPGTRPVIQKAILATGEGANGKSTWLSALVAFLGRRNVAAVSLHKLESDRFAGARIVGRLANICPDLPSAHLVGTSTFKAVCDGEGDPITAEKKFKDGYDYWPFCRLLFSANAPPQSPDSSYAFFRRWLVIPFERTFEEGDPARRDRGQLSAELARPGELSGVLNKALDHYPALRRRGFTETPTMRRAWEEFRAATDPVSVWLQRCTVTAPLAATPKHELLAAYNAFAADGGHPVLTGMAFGLALKRYWPEWQEAQRTVSGLAKVWCWVGIGLTSTHTPSGAP